MALTLGKCLLRSCREAAGITQADLSDRLHKVLGLSVSPQLISLYENNRRPMPPLNMRGVCIILGCTEADLYEWPR
ncbi:helix-turn-helix domain-containing protein [Paenibacillus anaericanus]